MSVPIRWDELQDGDLGFDHFNIRNMPQRLKRLKRDPWSGYEDVQQEITRDMLKLLGYSQKTFANEVIAAAYSQSRAQGSLILCVSVAVRSQPQWLLGRMAIACA